MSQKVTVIIVSWAVQKGQDQRRLKQQKRVTIIQVGAGGGNQTAGGTKPLRKDTAEMEKPVGHMSPNRRVLS